MTHSIAIRIENAGDEPTIRQVTQSAFADHPHSEGTEPAIVDALRAQGDLVLSHLAEVGGEVVGHAAWSAALLASGESGWFALGPISVRPDCQRQGVGSALIAAGAAYWRARGAKGLVLLGDPAYYSRFGFRCDTPLHIEGTLAEYFQVWPFVDSIPATSVRFAPAFRLARVTNR